jgi:hypothetical protein
VKLKWFLATSGGGVEEMVFVKERESLFAKERERAKLGPAPAGKCCVAINLDLSNVFGAIEEDEFGYLKKMNLEVVSGYLWL